MAACRTTKVYCASIRNTDILKNGEISHPLRAAEISAARNSRVKEQKTAVWKLLEYAFFDTYGKNIGDFDVVKGSDGKWRCADDCFFFSLSHTDDVCAVAIGDIPCGVDIEEFVPTRFGEAIAQKILCDEEHKEYERLTLDEKQVFCAKKWTQKESIFKKTGGEVFVSHSICCNDFLIVTQKLLIDDRQFFVTLCSDDSQEAEIEILN